MAKVLRFHCLFRKVSENHQIFLENELKMHKIVEVKGRMEQSDQKMPVQQMRNVILRNTDSKSQEIQLDH